MSSAIGSYDLAMVDRYGEADTLEIINDQIAVDRQKPKEDL